MHILRQITDRETLASAILSSQALYQSYLPLRLELVSAIVNNECDALYVDMKDAITVVRSRGLNWIGHKNEAIALLDTWRRSDEMKALKRSPSLRTDKPQDLDEASKLFTLLGKLRFFVKDFIANSPMPYWIDVKNRLPINLSYTEQRRLVRAFCRVQIHANILGPPPRTPGNGYQTEGWEVRPPGDIGPFLHFTEDARRVFFGTIPPWELEEMCSAVYYLGEVAKRASPEICNHLQSLADTVNVNPEDEEWHDCFEYWPEEIQPPWWSGYESVTEALTSIPREISSVANLGPEMVYQLIFEDSIVLKQNLVIANSTESSWVGGFADWVARVLAQESFCPLLFPADRYQECSLRDIWDAFPHSERPNAAWWDNYIGNRNDLENPSIRLEDAIRDFLLAWEVEKGLEWCYAIWDDVRLIQWAMPDLNWYPRR